ncbi:pyruvate, phosphate dikinase, partial [Candidatus Woesearchaeota archaeon]|nr:pyruvate, phosphate dikinase [Candidatus Woesearchaeota archaeon]
EIQENIKKIEEKTGKRFGDEENPLLVSVRSGAPISMPGMMDTILNLGLNDATVKGLAKATNNERFAYDCYRRFIQMFGNVVLGMEHAKFEDILEHFKKQKEVEQDFELDADTLKSIVERYKEIIKKETGKDFPQEPKQQLDLAIEAVFKSWNNKRAITYRRINNIPDDMGTAVNVQAMVFGNLGDDSGTGVGFTRNPATGENVLYGEYLLNAQGEDVVAGIRTPKPIHELKNDIPEAFDELVKVRELLEKHYKDMQDFEFTIEHRKLYLLQTRTGKRTAVAAVKIAVDMVKEGLIDKETAVLRVDPNSLDQLLHKQLDPVAKNEAEVLTKGLPASPGAAVGEVVLTADKAKQLAESGRKVILVRTETSPEDIEGMHVAQGILTARGGMTSHAAVVARGMGKCCITGAGEITVNEKDGYFVVKGIQVNEGDYITLDGTTGEVYKGKLRVVEPELSGAFAELMSWADSFRKLKVKTNADNPHDAAMARKFGAEGIGLCRTEHMFFEKDRIVAMREMILADNLEGRKKALDRLLPMQKEDFKGIFKAMDGLPVIIRLLDPPLHEFLPKDEESIKEVAEEMDIPVTTLKEKVESLHEFNPMLGFRGCRLSIKYPEITEMQVRAILEAAIECQEEGIKAIPQIEVPLVGNVKEFKLVKDIILRVAKEIGAEGKVSYEIGTMIEVPRAAITADEIAQEADFMSFGTNDLTQMGCGFSRDDSGKFLKEYVDKGIYARDPFQAIDREGVGKLMQICVEKARSVKPEIEIGICGEHGGEPSSVEFCHIIGLNDVSCSPYRVPIARLAAAQAAIKHK